MSAKADQVKSVIRSRGKWLTRKAEPEFYGCSQIRLVQSGQDYFELLEDLIQHAKQVIHLQTYIFEHDDTGKRVARALKEAAKRGVSVYVVVDGYASQGLSSKFISKLEASGVHFRFFDPLLKSKFFYFGRRLHHKVITIDDKFGLVGGINISDNYNDTLDAPAWLDWALLVEGNIVKPLREICERRAKDFGNQILEKPQLLQAKVSDNYFVRIRVNDWVRRKRQITVSYVQMLQRAQSHVTIMSSYFLPGKVLKRHIGLAAKRGVRIRVIMGHYSDVVLSRLAEQYMYRWLLRNNIEIYEYLPKIVHSKLAMYDGKWLTVGSYNVNNISAYASIELNLDVNNPQFVSKVDQRLERIMEQDCVLITKEDYERHTNLWDKFLQRSAYDIFRILLFIFTFYFRQRE
jgi:cardiolipin synthase A/B